MNNFGEIIEPSSRTTWEDWDENNSSTDTQTNLQFQKHIEIPNDIEIFILLEGKYLAHSIKQNVCNLELINSVPEISLKIYKMHSLESYVCIIYDYDIICSSEIIHLLEKYITNSKEVISMITKPLVEYATSEVCHEECVIRRLSTKNCKNSSLSKYPCLEQPNIISGISAGVVCLREHLDLSALALVFYTEYPEEHEQNEIHKILENFHFKFNPKPNGILNSNLYI
ncbi:uncharacterized protein LOC114248806 [Bombyx mandarina]|uniref:Proteasome assembly chaperone 1 n=1 Tax=Bombyx mandarina TaxID=7092 RepID=A0A6J2KCJ5_BOMMA|nr:uncharacterized protein LOC114248806 [Bombyx mandarina]